jgi:hypothetical protein
MSLMEEAIDAAVPPLGIARRIGASLKWLIAHPMTALALGLGVWGVIEHRAAAKWEGAYHKLVAETQSAAATAATNQAAVNHHPAAISAAIAEKSDAQAPAYYRHALDVADLHRVRPAPARVTGNADLPGTDHAPALDDRPAAPAELVCRPAADDRLLVGAAARAAQMLVDAQALIAGGAARPSAAGGERSGLK